MADYSKSYARTIQNEGGYRLVNVSSDRGGQTYAGIARNFFPQWPGWRYIDAKDLGNLQLSLLVEEFYRENFWNKVAGDQIDSQTKAEALFDFGVNAGVSTAIKLAQLVVDTVPDGAIGPETLQKLNAMEDAQFVLKFAIAKIARYAEICNKDKTQSKFLLGWINRTLGGLS